MGQLQAGLALVTIIAIGAGFAIAAEPFRVLLFVLAGITLLALLISLAVAYAAESVIAAIRDKNPAG